jgi:hypothetical protein
VQILDIRADGPILQAPNLDGDLNGANLEPVREKCLGSHVTLLCVDPRLD